FSTGSGRVFRLQCGHGSKAVENIVGVTESAAEPDASMRPRLEGRGEPGGCWIHTARIWSGFNAATARRPWRTFAFLLILLTRPVLQCGHGSKAVENQGSSDVLVGSHSLQCGHGSKAVENMIAWPVACSV